jgi:hypothetical protein
MLRNFVSTIILNLGVNLDIGALTLSGMGTYKEGIMIGEEENLEEELLTYRTLNKLEQHHTLVSRVLSPALHLHLQLWRPPSQQQQQQLPRSSPHDRLPSQVSISVSPLLPATIPPPSSFPLSLSVSLSVFTTLPTFSMRVGSNRRSPL